MNYTIYQQPLFQRLEQSQNILIAGAGGGFDVFSGLPLYLYLRAQGKQVILANFSFTWLSDTTAEKVFPYCYAIASRDADLSGRNYFPEKYLKIWLQMKEKDTEVYAFQRAGVTPLKKAYQYLIKQHAIDTIILVDGGTDSLLFGDEEELGTPQEDLCSMAAVYQSGVKHQFLVSLGFGIDHFHGVSHYRVLENISSMIQSGGYLGAFQLLKEMPSVQDYMNAIHFLNKHMPIRPSIVSNSIVNALEGKYGNHHATTRTEGSELWINPLMSFYWCFELRAVMQQVKYYEYIKKGDSFTAFNKGLFEYRQQLKEVRIQKKLPL